LSGACFSASASKVCTSIAVPGGEAKTYVSETRSKYYFAIVPKLNHLPPRDTVPVDLYAVSALICNVEGAIEELDFGMDAANSMRYPFQPYIYVRIACAAANYYTPRA